MFSLNDTMRYYLCPGPTCMRKGINGLCGVVHEQMGCDVKNGDVFIFINRERKLMKLLHAEDGGMVMYDVWRQVVSECLRMIPNRRRILWNGAIWW